jgi:hypothetical protein
MAVSAYSTTKSSERAISQFRSELDGGGLRPNLYEVHLDFPAGVDNGNLSTLINDGKFFCKAAALPAANMGVIEVPFRGRQLKVAGDRTFDTWTVTVLNDTDMGLRGAFERWINVLGTADSGQGRTNPSTYQKELYVYQLGRSLPDGSATGNKFKDTDITSLRRYKFWGCFPTNISQIDLAFDNNDAISEFTVEFQVQWWESDGNGGKSNAVPDKI